MQLEHHDDGARFTCRNNQVTLAALLLTTTSAAPSCKNQPTGKDGENEMLCLWSCACCSQVGRLTEHHVSLPHQC